MIEHPDSFRDEEDPKSAQTVLDALAQAEKVFDPWLNFCLRIDSIIGASTQIAEDIQRSGFVDQEFDLFWSSREILKPAIYSRPASPVVAPMFSDRDPIATTASEMLERSLVSTFKRSDFNDVMLGVRDGLIDTARGLPRVTYETGSKGKSVCFEYVDRCDFLHDPTRRWSEVGWVAFAAHMTERQAIKRFGKEKAEGLVYGDERDRLNGNRIGTFEKAKVWEVWHKADNRVYWVSEGCEDFLDSQPPFLDLEGFWPCPRPAYGTLRPRSLVPVPDYTRYERTLEQINELTRRVHGLLEWIRVRGLIPAGGDAATAVEAALAQQSDDVMLIPVPGAALMQGSGQFVQFLPLQEFAAAITGLLEARRELIQNYYELSGISDIMRGATEAQETLGAQQLKSQYGSVRVRDKIDELQRVAKDVAQISAEIMAEKFDKVTLLEMSQMDLLTDAEVKRRIKELQDYAKEELEALVEKAEEMAQQAMEQAQQQGQPLPPEAMQQAEAQFNEQQQAIIAKYQPQIEELGKKVTIDQVMKLLRDQKARAFSIEIATDSTIAPDEMAEKASRAEFLQAFSGTVASMQPILAMGESGAKLAGEMIKFALAPFRAGRSMDAAVDDFVDQAPAAIAAMQEQQSGPGEDMAALAEAEMEKARVAGQKVQLDGQKAQMDLQQKQMSMEAEFQEKAAKLQLEQEKIGQKGQELAMKYEELQAKIDNIRADTLKKLTEAEVEVSAQNLDEMKSLADLEFRAADQAMAQRSQATQEAQSVVDNQRAARGEDRADRQQGFSEQQVMRERE